MITRRVDETSTVDAHQFVREIAGRSTPIILRGQAIQWPAVRAALQSDEAIVRYIQRMDRGTPAEVLVGPPEIDGRFFYNEDMTACNFQKRSGSLGSLLEKLLSLRQSHEPVALYVGAASADEHLSTWNAENSLAVPLPGAIARLWMGNRTHVSTHFDEASNIAVVVAGKRRFTLFPPEQFANLYVGPFHFTIAGPPVSMVDLNAPDLDRYPRFAEAMQHGLIADLEPGDALFIPPIWWHNVNATRAFNIMVNYWWEAPHSVSPLGALSHAILAIRDLPAAQRSAWRSWFEHYVFNDAATQAGNHLPDHVKGVTAASSPERNARFSDLIARSLGKS